MLAFEENDNCIQIELQISAFSCAHALSHFSVEVPCGEITEVTNSEGWKVETPNTDPATGISGFKIDDIEGFGEDGAEGVFTVKYTVCAENENCLEIIKEGFSVAYKAATCVFYEDIEFPSSFSAKLITQDVSCHNGNNGSIDVEIEGGTAPYTYLWSNGSTAERLYGLKSGSYSVEITDSTGTVITLDTFLTQPESGISTDKNITNPTCGQNDGSIELTITGGTAPYTVSWNNGKTDTTLPDLYAGEYSVQILDANGCSKRETIVLKEESDLNVKLTPNFLECYQQGEGEVTSQVTGGQEPYTYLWSNGDTTANISRVNSGSYNLTVTDAKGCTSKASTYVGIKKMSLSTLVVNPTCFGGDDGQVGVADVNYGNEPYSYLWNNGDTTSTLTDVSSGSYRVTVTDDYGCVATRTINLADRPEIVINHSLKRSDCSSENIEVEIDLQITGGTSSHTIYLNREEIMLPLTVTEVGTYTFTVIDGLGCEKTKSITVETVNSNIELTADIAQPACDGEPTGHVELMATGGTAPYVFHWSDGYVGAIRDNVEPGNYIVEGSDNNGCSASLDVVVDSADVVSAKISDISDFDCNTSNNMVIAGSEGAHTYTWDIIDNDTYYIESEDMDQMTFYAGTGSARIVYSVLSTEGCFASDTITVQCSEDGGNDNGDDDDDNFPTDSIIGSGCFYSAIDQITPVGDNCYKFKLWVYTNGECAHELSHLDVGLDNGTVSWASNSGGWQMEKNITDPTTGVYGLKVDDISGFGQNGEDKFSVEFEVCYDNADYFPEEIVIAYKAANGYTLEKIDIYENKESASVLNAWFYPNPFKGQGNLSVNASADTHVDIRVYDVYGNQAEVVYVGDIKANIEYTFEITGGESSERILFYRIKSNEGMEQGKILKIK